MNRWRNSKANLFVVCHSPFFYRHVENRLDGDYTVRWFRISADSSAEPDAFRAEIDQTAKDIEGRLGSKLAVVLVDREIFTWHEKRFACMTPFCSMKGTNQPIIVLATHDPERDREQDKKGSCFDLICKPDIDRSEFLLHIEGVLRRERRVRKARAKLRSQKVWTGLAGLGGIVLGSLLTAFPLGNHLWPGWDASILESGGKGDGASYVLHVRNTGNWTLTGCEIRRLPEGFTYDGLCRGMAIGRLEAGSVRCFPFRVLSGTDEDMRRLQGATIEIIGPRAFGVGRQIVAYAVFPEHEGTSRGRRPHATAPEATRFTSPVLLRSKATGKNAAAATAIETTAQKNSQVLSVAPR
ncbi:MAG: hypothetical protein R6X25_15245 [Candidatus Krumholzibacteriia bacterium]